MTNQKSSDIIPAMFFATAVTMILTNLTEYISVLVDGIITSRFLGHEAYSAVALFNPLIGLLLLVSNAITTGSQVEISRSLGAGNRDKANSAFSITLLIMAVAAFILIMAWLIIPGELLSITGVSAENHAHLYSDMIGYVNGYMFGAPLLMVIQVIGPVIVMDGGRTLFTVSAATMGVCDIAFDLVNVFVFHGGTFGMGLATSLSYLVQLAILMTHFFKRTCGFGFSLKAFSPGQIADIVRAGSPTFVRKIANLLRELFINRFNLAIALTTAAVAARGIQTDINTVLFCLGLGIGKTLITMTGIYYGSDDRLGITRLFSYSMRLSVIMSGTVGIVMFIAAPYIAGAFSNEREVVELGTFSIRCMAFGIVPDVVVSALMGYLQGINNRRFLNVINIFDRLVIPVICALILGTLFGSKGIMASIAVGKIILLVLVMAVILARTWLRAKRFPTRLEDFMFLPENFGGSEGDNIYAAIQTTDDALHESRRAREFCMSHSVRRRTAELMSLFIEEMAVNIIRHGRARTGQKFAVDYRLSLNGNTLCMTLRDCCQHFDPVAFYKAHGEDSPADMLGISIVMKLAKDIRYFSAFGSNNIIVSIGSGEARA
ncbi:MAG: ATP-binding protein [Synergistaceae bacterium]|nr:ATP-binding protein [Synergistaceae bacterium]